MLKTKYYPVDVDKKIIYNDPKSREIDASSSSEQYKGLNTIGIKGSRLIGFNCYQSFSIQDPPSKG